MITYLKIIVIVLGVMIAAGVAVIGIKLAEKNDELAELGEDAGAPPGVEGTARQATASLPAIRDLGLPAGSHVRHMTADGHHLAVTIAVSDAGERIVIIDIRDGQVVGNIGLEGAP